MNKLSLTEAVAKRLNAPARVGAVAVEAVLDTIARELADGGVVRITGFGTFETVERPARTAHNPQDMAPVQVPEHTRPRFRPGQNLKDLVNGDRPVPLDGSAIAKAPKGSLTGGAR